jgi:F-type H+-transporting ATPase subunit a
MANGTRKRVQASRVNQVFLEMIITYILSQVKTAFGTEKRARKFFPLFMSLFILIVVANQLSALPLIYQVTLDGSTILRTATADLMLTMGLALLVIVIGQIISFKHAPIAHIGKYLKFGAFLKVRSFGDFGHAVLELFLGLLDIIGEISKVLSMSFRLFGNVFAGEVLVLVISSLSIYTRYIVPIPFMLISIFSGFVQALVFTLLSIQFISGMLPPPSEEELKQERNQNTTPVPAATT